MTGFRNHFQAIFLVETDLVHPKIWVIIPGHICVPINQGIHSAAFLCGSDP